MLGANTMDVDAGEYGIIRSPERLVDASTGTAHLRLVPTYLERLYGPELAGPRVPCERDPSPFRLLRGSEPIDVTLRSGMSPEEVSAGMVFEPAGDFEGRSWWRWIAYALTPFGWVFHPTPHFRISGEREELEALTLTPSCVGPDQGFVDAASALERDLGPPHESRDGRPAKRMRHWTYEWGEVHVWHEYRDREAEVAILWSR